MKNARTAAIVALTLSTLGPLAGWATPAEAAPKRPATPVQVGGEPELDACLSQGIVKGLSSGASGFLSVRTSPSTKAAELDRLRNNADVIFCDERGAFTGIVYGGRDGCGVTTPIAKRAAYSGPCKSGWVATKYLFMTAG